MPKAEKQSKNHQKKTSRALGLSAARETFSTLIFNALYIACIKQHLEFSKLKWEDILPFILCAENHADPIMYNGQCVVFEEFVFKNLRIIQLHFYHNFYGGRKKNPATAQFLQKFISRVQQMFSEKDESITVSNEAVFDDKQTSGLQTVDVLQAFSLSNFNTFLDRSGETLISEYRKKQSTNQAQRAFERYRDKKSKATSTFPDATEQVDSVGSLFHCLDDCSNEAKMLQLDKTDAAELTENLFNCV